MSELFKLSICLLVSFCYFFGSVFVKALWDGNLPFSKGKVITLDDLRKLAGNEAFAVKFDGEGGFILREQS